MASSWRNTRSYRVWRANIIRRDKVCKICGSKQKRHAHHINHATYFPEQKFDIENGVCLCSNCHSIYHNKYHGGTRKKCDFKGYVRFKKIIQYAKDLM